MSGRPLVDIVKAGQKSSEEWKQKWIAFTQHLDGIRDPNRHDDATLQSFVDQHRGEFQHHPWFGQALAGNLPPPRTHPNPPGQPGFPGGMGMGMPQAQQQPQPMHPSGPAAMAMVDAIKSGQRSDPNFKEAWWNFCDTYCEGIRDPNRHPVQNLELFLSEHKPGMGGPPADPAAGMDLGLGGMPMPGKGGAPPPGARQTILVHGLPQQATAAIIAEYFGHFGTVVFLELKVDGLGAPSGSATVGLLPGGDGAPPVQGLQHEILGVQVGVQVAAGPGGGKGGYGAQRPGPYGKGM